MQEMFIQTEDQRAILDSVHRFVETEVTPRAADLDANKDPEDSFSWEIVEAADAFGLRTMTLSEEYGGLSSDMLTTSMVVEELGRGDLGTSVVFAQTLKIAKLMENALNDDQKARSLVPFRDDSRAILSICSTDIIKQLIRTTAKFCKLVGKIAMDNSYNYKIKTSQEGEYDD